MKNPNTLQRYHEESCQGNHSGCGVCSAPATRPLVCVASRNYLRCDHCMATLMDPAQWLSPEMEYAQYLEHKNDLSDIGYRKFLSKLAAPLLKKLASGQDGLDYGCGPGPVLAQMLSKAGHNVSFFDPFFFPDQTLLSELYDFITCTETIEHFHHPAEEFARFERMLRPGGWLAVMTCFQNDDARFSSWHYRRDPTHVVFYREETLRHIARSYGWSCEIPVKDVALMQKPLSR
jgi:SAM-dependent methyltransferase